MRPPTGSASPLKGGLVQNSEPEVCSEEVLDWLTALVTHPTAFYLEDIKFAPKPASKHASEKNAAESGTAKTNVNGKQGGVETVPSSLDWTSFLETGKQPACTEFLGGNIQAYDSPDVEVRAGFVVSLGKDAARLNAKFSKYMRSIRKNILVALTLNRVKIAGETWYRFTPPDASKKNCVLTFGFHGNYFVAAYGKGEVEAILARWHKPKPTWLGQAMAQSDVARRTGILYLNLKAIREKLLSFAETQMPAAEKKKLVGMVDLLGFDNVDSYVSTTGLEDYGMIGRTLLTTSGEPHGILNMVSDRPLTAKDLEPIPQDALLAIAVRMDLDRALRDVLAFYDKAGAISPDLQKQVAEVKKQLDELKRERGIDLHRILSAVGDSWRIYNAPAEGEIPFLGWTAVVSIRDRPALVEAWEKLCARWKRKDSRKAERTNPQNPANWRRWSSASAALPGTKSTTSPSSRSCPLSASASARW